jgi:hypothetical protein
MRILFLVMACALLASCGTTMSGRDRCASLVDAAWKDLDSAKVQGFAGSISFSKAAALLTRAKANQAVEDFAECAETAQRAQFYIEESRKGR